MIEHPVAIALACWAGVILLIFFVGDAFHEEPITLERIVEALRQDRTRMTVSKEIVQPLGFEAMKGAPYGLTSLRLRLYYWGNPECRSQDASVVIYAEFLMGLRGSITILPADWTEGPERSFGASIRYPQLSQREKLYATNIMNIAGELIRESAVSASVCA